MKSDKNLKYRAVTNAIAELIEAEGIYKTNDAIAEALSDTRKKSFIAKEKVNPSNGADCIQRMLGKKCKKHLPSGQCDCFPWAAHDHVSIWNKDGKPAIYVAQPYDLNLKDLKGLIAYCEKYKLNCWLNAHDSWHNPGQTISLQLREKE